MSRSVTKKTWMNVHLLHKALTHRAAPKKTTEDPSSGGAGLLVQMCSKLQGMDIASLRHTFPIWNPRGLSGEGHMHPRAAVIWHCDVSCWRPQQKDPQGWTHGSTHSARHNGNQMENARGLNPLIRNSESITVMPVIKLLALWQARCGEVFFSLLLAEQDETFCTPSLGLTSRTHPLGGWISIRSADVELGDADLTFDD